MCCQWGGSNAGELAFLPLLALAHAHLGDHNKAEEFLAQTLASQDKLDRDALVDLAAVFIVMLHVEKAVKLLEEILNKQPQHSLALARLGYCRILQDDSDAALKLYKQSAYINPERLSLLHNLIPLYIKKSKFESATTTLKMAERRLAIIANELPDVVLQRYRKQHNLFQLNIWVVKGQFAYAERWLQLKEWHDDFIDDEKKDSKKYAYKQEDSLVFWVTEYSNLLAYNDHHQQAAEILREYGKHYPDNQILCLQMAELAKLQGHHMQAVKLIKRALKDNTEDINLWVQLSSACLHHFEQQAQQAALRAMELSDALEEGEENPLEKIKILQAQAKLALAQIESQEQNFAKAEKLYREILAEHKNFVPALQGLGQQLLQQGDIDEAMELFETVKKLNPVRGYTSLINAHRFPTEITTLEKIEKAAKVPSLEGSVRTGIYFQLSAAWAKRKEYDRAFAFAKQGNTASKKFLNYDGKQHRNHCGGIRQGFCEDLYKHRPDYGVDSTLPVYVLGMPRSGTTLVEQIISGHSQIFGAGELGVVPQVIQGLNRWERHVGSGRVYPDCMDDLTPYVTKRIARSVLQELQEFAPQAKHVVDKMPHNFENIGLIKFLFPNAKIISVRRDPRDIAISNYFTDYQAKHGGMGFAYDLTDIGEQLADHNLLMHHWDRVFPGEILTINYEDVVEDLEGCARKMLGYIGVAWEQQVLKFNELKRTVKTASVWQVRQPIYKSSKAKWKNYQKHLAPLLKGTNKKIVFETPDTITLPQPGFLTDGIAHYNENRLDEAELSFKKMLHHNPNHAACNYMLGLVYLSKNHVEDGIAAIEKAIHKAPWHKEW
ncbi:MAG: sulfotransferase, partial [Magnetococcales bacterium]|nr:sulfotransferase [Magnetococcales bacterium]